MAPAPHSQVGAALALSPDEHRLFVVDEDHRALRIADLPLKERGFQTVDLPGAPAQVVVAARKLLVTIREPSLLWIGDVDGGAVKEAARVALPNDAWGITVSPDGQGALVSSAWSARVSFVDLKAVAVRWSVEVPREPRGIAITPDGARAFVSHLVGSDLTEIDLRAASPVPSRVRLPAAPLRAAEGPLPAALGYALALDASGDRLFSARHALGALGKNAWFGASTVDVLLTASREPLAPAARPETPGLRSELSRELISGGDTKLAGTSLTPFTQPRALLYRKRTKTLLVAGEGDDRVAELDALAVDPTMAVIRIYPVATSYHPAIRVAAQGAAPAGLALTRDESTLHVYCRATNDVVQIPLLEPEDRTSGVTSTDFLTKARPSLALGEDTLGPGGATGRKLFYGALDSAVSGGLACAGCHPEGRDDGHVWHEATFVTEDGEVTTFVGSASNVPAEAHARGYPRRTPMLAGRVAAEGPYGWHAESPTAIDREVRGFALHRWGAVPESAPDAAEVRAKAIADFLRRGLVPPATATEQSDAARRGRELFASQELGCIRCHVPSTSYTNRQPYPLPPLPTRSGFDEETITEFKAPSLLYLSGRAPYFHDGSAESLESLVENNRDRMGKTSHLKKEERADLVAFLRTL